MLTEPFLIGTRTAPSRVLFGPHETNLGRERSLSDRHVAYYRERALGGCGVIETRRGQRGRNAKQMPGPARSLPEPLRDTAQCRTARV